MNEPMTNERLAEIRADHCAMETAEVVDLLAEVDRLRTGITRLADELMGALDDCDPEDRWDRGHAAALRVVVARLRDLSPPAETRGGER